MKKLSILAVAIGVLLPMASANAAAYAPQLWAAGNGAALANILNAIKGLLAEGSYAQLIEMVGIGAFIFTAVSATFLNVKPQQIIIFFATFALILTVTFRSTMNVTVHDPVNQYTDVVTDVPLIVAFPATLISSVGHFLLEGVETFFAYPTPFGAGSSRLSLERSGQFNLIAQMVHDASVVKIQDTHIRASLHAYTEDCVVPMLYSGTKDIEQLKQSTNLWADLNNPNRAMLTTYYSDTYPQGDIRTCPDAHTALAQDFENEAPKLVGAAFSSFKYTNATNFFSGAYSDAQTYLTGNSSPATSAELLRNNAVINSFMGAANDVTSTMGDTSGLSYALNSAKAEAAQTTGWQITANIFQRVMGYLYTVMQAFIIAVIPIAVVAFIIPSYGAKIAGSLFKVMVWLALWQPLLGIVNFIIASFLKQGVGGIMSNGVTMGNIGALTQASQNASLAASMFATSIPLISWGLVSGGQFALTQFLAEGAGAVQARGAANEIAAGNASSNQTSLDNTRNNNNDLVHRFSMGEASQELHSTRGASLLQHGAGITGDYAGRQITASRDTSQTLAASVGGGLTNQASDTASHRLSGSTSRSTQRALKDDFAAATGAATQQGLTTGTNASVGSNAGTSISSGMSGSSHVTTGSGSRSGMSVGLRNPFTSRTSTSQAAESTMGGAMAHAGAGKSEGELAQYVEGRAKQYEAAGGSGAGMLQKMTAQAKSLPGKIGGKMLGVLQAVDIHGSEQWQASVDFGNRMGAKTESDASTGRNRQFGVQQQQQQQRQDINRYMRSFANGLVQANELRSEDTGTFVHDASNMYAATESASSQTSASERASVPVQNAGLDYGAEAISAHDARAADTRQQIDDYRANAEAKAADNRGAAGDAYSDVIGQGPGFSTGEAADNARNAHKIMNTVDQAGNPVFDADQRHKMADVQEGAVAAQNLQLQAEKAGQSDAMSSADPIGNLGTSLKGSWDLAKMSIKKGIESMDGLSEAEQADLQAQYNDLNRAMARSKHLPMAGGMPDGKQAPDDQEVPARMIDFVHSYQQARSQSLAYDQAKATQATADQPEAPIYSNVDQTGTNLDEQDSRVTLGDFEVLNR